MKKVILFFFGTFVISAIFAQNDDEKTIVINCSVFHVTKPLTELFAQNTLDEEKDKDKNESKDRERRVPQTFLKSIADGPEYGNDPSIIQNSMGIIQGRTPIQNWQGQSNVPPPDPTGAAGPNNYVQLVNGTGTAFTVYSKTGAMLLTGGVDNLWNPTTFGLGDPVLLYDKFADRWLISQFDFNGTILIAISQTADPTGAYYTYNFPMTFFPDYFKLSVWADGYYMGSNNGISKICCFERTKMLAGDPAARVVIKTITAPTNGFFLPMPGDADGTIPPNGTPCPFVYYTDNGWGGSNNDGIKIHEMLVNWIPSTPTATITAKPFIPTSAFDTSSDPNWDDIAQPGTSQKLDGLAGVLMFRAQWRKWTTYNSLLITWGIKISSTQRSIKWCELRQNGTTWSLYQEGIYAPDANNRWMQSIAMDDNGSIALAYCKSSSTVSPTLCYTGRKATDPLGQMTFAEQTAVAGSGAQFGTNRFGDYSQTSLDPTDGITFWHTGEYVDNSNYVTRIYSFKLALTTGIDENQNNPEFIVSKSQNSINVRAHKLPSNEKMQINLFDIEGKLLSNKTVSPFSNSFETDIDVSGLANGTYLVSIGNNGFQKVVKVTLN